MKRPKLTETEKLLSKTFFHIRRAQSFLGEAHAEAHASGQGHKTLSDISASRKILEVLASMISNTEAVQPLAERQNSVA